MAECASCGRELTDKHVFCPSCGTSVKKEVAVDSQAASSPEPGRTACPSCGGSLPAGATFCGKCGTKLPGSGDPAAGSVTEVKPQEPESQPQPREAGPIVPPPSAVPLERPVAAPQPVPVAAAVPPSPAAGAFRPTPGPQSQGYSVPPAPQPIPQAMPQPAPTFGGYQGASSSFGDYLTFRRMLTPHIGQIVFWLFEAINVLYWVKFIHDFRYSALSVIFGLLALIISILIIRIVMEAVFVVFRNHKE